MRVKDNGLHNIVAKQSKESSKPRTTDYITLLLDKVRNLLIPHFPTLPLFNESLQSLLSMRLYPLSLWTSGAIQRVFRIVVSNADHRYVLSLKF